MEKMNENMNDVNAAVSSSAGRLFLRRGCKTLLKTKR